MNAHCTVSRPALVYPEHRLTLAGMLAMAKRVYGGEAHYPVIARMIENTQIAERRFVIPIESLERPRGLPERTQLHSSHARRLAREVVIQALEQAEVEAGDIDLIITTSCTSFVMPSLDAYLINELGLEPTIRRMPLAQLGCVGGVSALLKAKDHCRAYPGARVLIVALELSSLCFFPEQKDLTSAVCASIFGDGAAACVVSGAEHEARPGLRLGESLSYTVANSEHFIRYQILEGGFHLTLDRGVMHAIPKLAPLIEQFAAKEQDSTIEFMIAHTGGRRILDGLADSLGLDDVLLAHSRASLRAVGNTASVSVFDVLARRYAQTREPGRCERGLVVGFGPGFTMEMLSATWE